MFCNDDGLAQDLTQIGKTEDDTVWAGRCRMMTMLHAQK